MRLPLRLASPMRHIVVLLTLIAIGGLVYYSLAPTYPQRPDFTLPDLDGETRAITDFDGKVVVLNFWATWCIPCREEIPMLIEAQDDLGAAGLQIIGIAVDQRQPTAQFAHEYAINYPVLVDLSKAARVQDRYTKKGSPAAASLPFTAIIDRQGRIRARVPGKLDRAQFDKLVKPLL
ncbi:MAG TPA: TlpA disulfide reductase family protein [Salinisphaeraceae bacterium]|nr:TlpA disulfide reductase family protein [Salinisphaeraceae bacterium]